MYKDFSSLPDFQLSTELFRFLHHLPTANSGSLNPILCCNCQLKRLSQFCWQQLTRCQSQSYFATGGLPPICSSWRQSPWDSRPVFFLTEHLRSQSLCNILSNESLDLSFTIAAGPRQRSHSQVRVPRDSYPPFTVSDSRLPQFRGPGLRIYISQEQAGPVIPPGTGFPFRRLLRLAGLRWMHSTPPPHGNS
jgi:hypothetical protein